MHKKILAPKGLKKEIILLKKFLNRKYTFYLENEKYLLCYLLERKYVFKQNMFLKKKAYIYFF